VPPRVPARKLIPPLPLLRQALGDPLALGHAVRSKRSEQLAPRTASADRVVDSICPYVEEVSVGLMERRLGELAEPYAHGEAAAFSKLAKGLSIAGAATIALRGRSRPGAALGGVMVLAGSVCERWSVFKAGVASAADPKYTVGPQRERIDRGESRGATS
jgi:hypothetical protein